MALLREVLNRGISGPEKGHLQIDCAKVVFLQCLSYSQYRSPYITTLGNDP